MTTFKKIYGKALGDYICGGNLNIFGMPLPGKDARQVKFKITPRTGQESLGEITIIYKDGTERIFPIDSDMQQSFDEAMFTYFKKGKEIIMRDRLDDKNEFRGVPLRFKVRYEPESLKDEEIRVEVDFKGGKKISIPIGNEFKLIR